MNKNKIIEELNLPKRMVITGGMPYGNKPLHLGHIGAIFIWADVYARFIRDIIGKENVIFISGTDGFGTTVEEKHRLLVESGENISLEDYVKKFHDLQKKTFEDYDISLNLFAASCFGRSYEWHKETSKEFFETMFSKGVVSCHSSKQFYDTKLGKILNGRQVEGKCPIANCQSETAYADECSLGHQYSPNELIDPVSKLTNTKPELKEVTNYYFDLEKYKDKLKEFILKCEDNPKVRKFMTRDMKEFLLPPSTFIPCEVVEQNAQFFDNIKAENITLDEKRNLMIYTFSRLSDRDEFCEELNARGIHFMNNKTIAPLRLSGNIKWGVPFPKLDGGYSDDLTFYVWPESLWAPISFTKTYLEQTNSNTTWKDWWASKDAEVVQFIGEDNVYFYALAQTGMFFAMQNKEELDPEEGQLRQTTVVAHKHLLLSGQKASSSGARHAPTAQELLTCYTPEQLRCHFISQNINSVAVNFMSKAFFPEDFVRNTGDPVVAQGNTLTNVYNRIIRSVFYSLQEYFDAKIPANKPSEEVIAKANEVLAQYVSKYKAIKLNELMPLIDTYLRAVNLNWAEKSKTDDNAVRSQLIADTIHAIKTALLMLHPIAPKGTGLVVEYMNGDEKLFDWNNSELTFTEIYPDIKEFKTIPPKFDFFKKHESQLV